MRLTTLFKDEMDDEKNSYIGACIHPQNGISKLHWGSRFGVC